MKLSEHTVEVLKNFATINQNLVIKEGSTLTTMSAMKNIVAKADVEESFDKEVAIYDLNEFLASISLSTSPILEFNDGFVTIKEEKNPKNVGRNNSEKNRTKNQKKLGGGKRKKNEKKKN